MESLARAAAAEPARSELLVPLLSGPEHWLFRSHNIARIALPERITRIPGADSALVGVVSWAGTIYTLVDFNLLLGRTAVLRNMKSRIVFLEQDIGATGSEGGAPLALLVDRVLDLTALPATPLGKTPYSQAHGTREGPEGVLYLIANIEALCAGS